MIIQTEVHSYEFPLLYRRFLALTGAEAWEKRLAELGQELGYNRFFRDYLQESHWLELEMARTHLYFEENNEFPSPSSSWQAYAFQTFVAVIIFVYNRLSPAGKKRVEGRLRHALKSSVEFQSLQYEMEIASFLMKHGNDVEFHDFEEGGGFDFLASNGDAKLEVECKIITADIGRQIHRRKLILLGQKLNPHISKWLENSTGGLRMQIELPGRLEGNEQHQKEIVNLAAAAMENGGTVDENDISIICEKFEISQLPLYAKDPQEAFLEKVREYVMRDGHKENSSLVAFKPNKCGIIIEISSRRPDQVLDYIYRQLKNGAKKQLTKNRPGFLAARLLDVTAAQFQELVQEDESGLVLMTNRLFRGQKHVLNVVYSGPGQLRQVQDYYEGVPVPSVSSSSGVCLFTNQENPAAKDSCYRQIVEPD